MAGEHDFGVHAGHLAKRRGPLAGVSLCLLRVSGVRHGPDEQIPGVKNALFRYPGPGGVVRLASSVVELEREPARSEGQSTVVRDIGISVAVWPAEAFRGD